MKDRYGHDYSDLLTMQREHLDRWQTRLVPEVFKAVKLVASGDIVRARNGRYSLPTPSPANSEVPATTNA
jgi:hypothetical protein